MQFDVHTFVINKELLVIVFAMKSFIMHSLDEFLKSTYM